MKRALSTAELGVRTAIILTIAVLVLSQIGATSLAGDGIVLSCGSNLDGRTGLGVDGGETLVATPIDTANLMGKTITQVAAGLDHNLLLADDGTVFSFGDNSHGQTGLGIYYPWSTLVATPIDTTNLAGKTITQVAAGYSHSLLLTDDGTVFSFGSNTSGQTGLGTGIGETAVATPIDTTNLGGKTITQVAAGGGYSLLLADDGTVFSFGDNAWGQTGLGVDSGESLVATPIDTTNLAGKTIAQVAAGGDHSLLLADDGTVVSFGSNWKGQVGLGTYTSLYSVSIATPIDTTNLSGKSIAQVAAGNSASLLLADDGTVFSFGNNSAAQTGLGTEVGVTLLATPIDTTNLAGKTITEVAASGHGLLLADDGTVFSFGVNSHGQTGLGTDVGVALVATPLDTANLAGLRVTGVSAGQWHGLLLTVPVPEPGSATLVLLAGLSLLVCRRCR